MRRIRANPELSREQLEVIAALFRVLAEPARLRILHLLRKGEKNVGELTEALKTTQPNVSKHLRVLERAGLIGRRQSGTNVYCSISDPTVFALCDLVCSGRLRDSRLRSP